MIGEILLVALAFVGGALFGVRDCKKRYHIPKGVTTLYPLGDGLFSTYEVKNDGTINE